MINKEFIKEENTIDQILLGIFELSIGEIIDLDMEEKIELIQAECEELKNKYNTEKEKYEINDNVLEIRNLIKKQMMKRQEKILDEKIDTLFNHLQSNNIDLNTFAKTKIEIANNTNNDIIIHLLERGNKDNNFVNKIEILSTEAAKDKKYFYNLSEQTAFLLNRDGKGSLMIEFENTL